MNNLLCIEPLGDPERLRRCVSAEELRQAEAMRSPRRQAEFLSWRALVRRHLPDAEIAYDAVGAPFLRNSPLRIGVSHGAGHVAVCLSERRCAVDIESPRRDFARIASRFASGGELALWDDPLLLPLLWSAKETLYKYAGRRELRLLEDLLIERIDPAAGRMTGRILGGGPLRIDFRAEPGYVATWILHEAP